MTDKRQARGIFWGAVLMLGGAWFLLSSLGFYLPTMAQLWPGFPLLSGLAFLISFATQKNADPGLIFPGTSSTLIGLFFFGFTFEYWDWTEMEVLWPVFPLIMGAAFVTTWLAGRCRHPGLLVPGTAALSVGVLGLFFTLGGMSWQSTRLLGSLLLVLVGLMIVVRSLRSR